MEEPYKINEKIEAPSVRLVGDNVDIGIYTLAEARIVAYRQGLDLVEISPKISPPVCKVIDYLKFKYEQKRKQKEIKAKSQKTVIKELRFTPTTDDHDFNFKLKYAIKFLSEGAKLRVFMIFSRGSIQSKDRGELLLLNFAKELEKYGKVDQLPKMDEKKHGSAFKMLLTMSPKNTKN